MRPSARRVVAAVTTLASAVAVAGATQLSAMPAYAEPATGSAGLFTPITPARAYDSREATRGKGKPLGPGEVRRVLLAGVAGVPAAGVAAVVANVTAVTPTASGYLTVWPAGSTRPPTSNVSFAAAQTVPNLVTVPLGADGSVDVYNHAGSTHLVVDVTGFYATTDGPAGSRFTAVAPQRLLDTRDGTGSSATPVAGGERRDVVIAGRGGVPAGSTAVTVNVTVTNPTASGFLTVTPAGESSAVSSLNFIAGQTVANLAVVKLSGDGRLSAFNHSGAVDVIFDVVGYYSAQGARLHTFAPQRRLDTRGRPLGAREARTLRTSPGARAAIANVTVTGPTAPGFLTVYPADQPRPATSSLNFRARQTVANLVTVGVDATGALAIYNSAGSTDVVVDLVGEFHDDGSSPAPPPAPSPSPSPSPPAPSPAPSPSAAPPPPAPAPTTDVQPAFPIRAAFYYPWYTSTPRSRFRPTPTPYDVEDPAFLAHQVKVMRYAGMNAGIAHWGMNYLEDQRFPKLLRAADGTAFRWSIQYEPEGRTDGTQPTVAKIRGDLQYIKSKYGADRNFLRVGGKPVIFVWTEASDGCAMAQRWRDANATVGFYVVLKRFTGYLSCAAQPNSWHQYAPAHRASDVRPHAYSISPGFYSLWESTPRLGRDINAFATAVQQMVASRANWQLVTTFNEWGEGTAIESAYEWRSASGSGAYVDTLHRYLGTTR